MNILEREALFTPGIERSERVFYLSWGSLIYRKVVRMKN